MFKHLRYTFILLKKNLNTTESKVLFTLYFIFSTMNNNLCDNFEIDN